MTFLTSDTRNLDINKTYDGYESSRKQVIAMFFIVFAIMAFCVVWLRASYGVEVTDEAFAISEAHLIIHGAIPYTDIWSQTPLTSLLIVPFIKLFIVITGGTEGIFLYMLRVAVIVRACVAGGLWLLLRRRMGTYVAGACALLLFLCNIGRTLNYNSISLYMLALAGALLYNGSYQENINKAALCYAGAGVAMAVCALAHVTQVVNCMLLAGIILLLDRRRWRRMPLWLIYTLFGLLLAIIITLGLELASDWMLFRGMRIMLMENNYFKIPRPSILKHATRLFDDLSEWGIRYMKVFIPALVLLPGPLFFLYGRSRRRLLLRCTVAASLAASSACLLYLIIFRKGNALSSDHAALLLFLIVPLYVAILPGASRERRECGRLLCFFYIPSLICLLTSLASHSSIGARYYTLTMGAILTIPVAAEVIRVYFLTDDLSLPCLRWVVQAVPAVMALLFAGNLIVNLYTNAYREAPIVEQTYRMQSGVYKGCYTSPDRGTRIEELEHELNNLLDSDDTVLFSDLMPTAYLMTEARPFTPSTWDPTMYRYGFQDDDIFMEYYQMKGDIPDKIIYINSEGRALSIDDDQNEWADFIYENYMQTFEHGEGLFYMRVFEIIDDNN